MFIFFFAPIWGIQKFQKCQPSSRWVVSLTFIYIFGCDNFRFCGCADKESSEDFSKNTERLRRSTSTCRSIQIENNDALLCCFELNPTWSWRSICLVPYFLSLNVAKCMYNSPNILDCMKFRPLQILWEKPCSKFDCYQRIFCQVTFLLQIKFLTSYRVLKCEILHHHCVTHNSRYLRIVHT